MEVVSPAASAATIKSNLFVLILSVSFCLVVVVCVVNISKGRFPVNSFLSFF